jgi:hypothetical protein
MAARYWVGGTGNWSDATNHWSDSSGGSPGAGFLPTSADDVYIDNNSHTTNFTISLNVDGNCHDFDTSGLTSKVLTFNNSSNNKKLNIYGSIDIPGSVILNWSSTSQIIFRSTSAETINIPAVLSFSAIHFNGVGGSWTLLNNFQSTTASITLFNGELNVNNYTIILNTIVTAAGTKTLTLGSGTISVFRWQNSNSINFTFNYNTGTIKIRSGIAEISGATTFYNLIIESHDSDGWKSVELSANINILNLFTVDGLSNKRRTWIRSSAINTRRTITSNSNNIRYADFMNITGAGSASWDLSAVTGGIGNAGNNSGILFSASKTCYWYGAGGNWSDTSKWFSATGGSGTGNYYPLCHDNVIIDENSLLGITDINYDSTSTCTDFDCSAITYNLNIATGSSNHFRFIVFGSIYLSSLLDFTSSTFSIYFYSRINTYLNTSGVDIKAITVANYNVNLIFLSDVTCSNSIQFLANTLGGIDMNDYNLIAGQLNYFGRAFFLRSGTLTLTCAYGIALYISGNGVECGTSTIRISPSSSVANATNYFNSTTLQLNILIFEGSNTGFTEISSLGTLVKTRINSLIIDAGKRVRFSEMGTNELYNLTANGTELLPITITSMTAAQHKIVNLSTNDFTVEYCNISWSSVTGSPRIKTFLGKTWASINKAAGIAKASIRRIMGINVNSAWIARNSTNSGNNTGWNFE